MKNPGLHKSGRGRGCRAARPSFGDEISYLLTGDQVVVELSYL